MYELTLLKNGKRYFYKVTNNLLTDDIKRQRILEEMEKGTIKIVPYDRECLGSNSYDVHLGKTWPPMLTLNWMPKT